MSKLRKDNYAVAKTDAGLVYGKVTKVENLVVTLATPAGESARVLRVDTTKISAKEYVERGAVTATTFDAVDAGAIEAPAAPVSEEVGAAPVEKTSVVRPGGDRKPGPAGTGKKAVAISLYREMPNASRKELIGAFMNAGISKAGSNTYLQNIRNAVKDPTNSKFKSWSPSV